MNLDGSGKKNISNHPAIEWVYTTYEDKVFFISDRDTCYRCFFLYEMDTNGNHVRKVSDLQLEDSWGQPQQRQGMDCFRKKRQRAESPVIPAKM